MGARGTPEDTPSTRFGTVRARVQIRVRRGCISSPRHVKTSPSTRAAKLCLIAGNRLGPAPRKTIVLGSMWGREGRAGGGATCTAPPPYRPPGASSPALPPLAKLAAGPSSAPSSRACSVSSRPFGSGPCLLDGGPDGQRTSTKSLIPVLSCPSSDKSMKDGMHTKSRPAGAT